MTLSSNNANEMRVLLKKSGVTFPEKQTLA